MKRSVLLLVCSTAIVAIAVLGQVNSAYGYPTFLKAFQQKYCGEKASQTDEQKALTAEMKRVKTCNVCHDPRPHDAGKPHKKYRNPYGEALNKHLSEKDKKDVEKAIEMLSKIEAEKPDKDAPQTFGDLIKSGKVPFEYKDFKAAEEEEDEEDSQ